MWNFVSRSTSRVYAMVPSSKIEFLDLWSMANKRISEVSNSGFLKQNELQKLLTRLWDNRDFINDIQCKAQVRQKESTLPWISSTFRGCDSRNINVSPLCDLKNNLGSWTTKVRESYGMTDVPTYISSLPSSIRNVYSTEVMFEGEMITALTKVK